VVEVGVENPRTGSTYDVSNACVLSFYCISINNLFNCQPPPPLPSSCLRPVSGDLERVECGNVLKDGAGELIEESVRKMVSGREEALHEPDVPAVTGRQDGHVFGFAGLGHRDAVAGL
jgi:hypothetical protein